MTKNLCTDFGKSFVRSVKVTFNLGPFWAVVTTYQNLILRRKGQQNNPVMIGAVALLKDKSETSYSHLFKSLGFRRTLSFSVVKRLWIGWRNKPGEGVGLHLSASVPI